MGRCTMGGMRTDIVPDLEGVKTHGLNQVRQRAFLQHAKVVQRIEEVGGFHVSKRMIRHYV